MNPAIQDQQTETGSYRGLSPKQVEQIVDVYLGHRGGGLYVPISLDALPRLVASVCTCLAQPARPSVTGQSRRASDLKEPRSLDLPPAPCADHRLPQTPQSM